MGHFTTNFVPTTGKVFSITSARMRLISNTDSHADRSVLALLTTRMSGDVQIDDVTSGTMAATPNVD